MKLTKKERNNIYRCALNHYISQSEPRCGMCYSLMRVIQELYVVHWSYEYIFNNLPEFRKVKKKFADNKDSCDYWWSIMDRESRINAFNYMINETNRVSKRV